MLLYTPSPETYPLIDFCNILKKGGLYVVSTVYENDYKGDCDEYYTMENFWSYFINHVGMEWSWLLRIVVIFGIPLLGLLSLYHECNHRS